MTVRQHHFSSQEVEPGTQGQPWLNSEFEASLGYPDPTQTLFEQGKQDKVSVSLGLALSALRANCSCSGKVCYSHRPSSLFHSCLCLSQAHRWTPSSSAASVAPCSHQASVCFLTASFVVSLTLVSSCACPVTPLAFPEATVRACMVIVCQNGKCITDTGWGRSSVNKELA